MTTKSGGGEYLVSDPRLTVAEAAERAKPATHLKAEVCEPFGLGEVHAEHDIAVIKRKPGERGILSRAASDDAPTAAELDAFMAAATGTGKKTVANVTLYDPESPARGATLPTEGDTAEVWYRFANHCATACGLTIERQWVNFAVYGNPWTVLLNDAESGEDHMRRGMRFRLALSQALGAHGPQSVYVSYVATVQPIRINETSAPQQPTEAERLALNNAAAEREGEALRAEIARPPRLGFRSVAMAQYIKAIEQSERNGGAPIAEPGPTEAERVAAELARQPRGLSVEQWQAYLCSFEGTGPMPYRFTAADYATVRARVEAGELTVPERIMRHAPAPVVKRNWWER